MLRRFTVSIIVALAALAIVSCGIKGPLKLPPAKDAAAVPATGTVSGGGSDATPTSTPGTGTVTTPLPAPELPAPVSSPPSPAAPPPAAPPVAPGDKKP
jgi:predicted small lipoprotein YifL